MGEMWGDVKHNISELKSNISFKNREPPKKVPKFVISLDIHIFDSTLATELDLEFFFFFFFTVVLKS